MALACSKSLFKKLCKAFLTIYDEREAIAMAKNYLMDRFHVDAIGLAMNTKIVYDQAQFDYELGKFLEGMPYQYVVNFTYFYGLRFVTNKKALIPRPETEELVRWIVNENPTEGLKVLDVGTGTGCIAISLQAYLKKSICWGVDIAQEALELSENNANKNHRQVHFVKCNVLKEKLPGNEFDIIVSNPPYVPRSERSQMSRHVLDYEPELALFVDDSDPLVFYRAIARQGIEKLTEGGWLYFEVHENFAEAVSSLLEKEGYVNITLKQDLQNKDRMIRAAIASKQ